MPTPNPTTRREFKGAAAATTLVNPMTNTDLSFVLVAANNWPTGAVGKFVVTINRGQADEEKILCDSQTTRTVACLLANRGFDGTTAQAHAAGATVECTISAFDADEWNQHTNASTGVHGVATVAGLTETQTFTNKTLTAPTIGDFTNAAHTHAGAASGGITAARLVQATKTTAATSFTSATFLAPAWDAEDLDTDAFHDTVTNPSRITIPAGLGGKYRFKAKVQFSGQASGNQCVVCFVKNGAVVGTLSNRIGQVSAFAAGVDCPVYTEVDLQVVATDYVEAYIYSNATSPTLIGNGTVPSSSFFSAELLGA